MNGNRLTHNSNGPTPVREEVWREAYQLLQTIRFTGERGRYVRGEHVCVLIDTQTGDAPDTFDADLLIFPLGEEQVEVKGLPVAIAGHAEGYHVMRRGETNHRGFLTFKDLPQGEYRILVPKGVIAVTEPIRFPKALAAADVQRTRLFEEYRSEDNSFVCTLRETTAGEVVLIFDVVSPEWDRAKVEYALVEEPSGKVATVKVKGEPRPLAGQVALKREARGHYIARASLGYNLALPSRYSLRAYLVPHEEAERESDDPAC